MATIARESTGVATRLEVMPLANAAATVALVGYVLCAVVALVAYEVYIGFFQPWFHGMTLAPIRPTGDWFNLGTFVTGLITFGATVWLATAATAWLYNAWSRK
jgi:hypothetical protein